MAAGERPQPRRHVRALLSLRTGEEESDRGELGWVCSLVGLGLAQLGWLKPFFYLIVLFLFCVLVCKTNPFAIILFEQK